VSAFHFFWYASTSDVWPYFSRVIAVACRFCQATVRDVQAFYWMWTYKVGFEVKVKAVLDYLCSSFEVFSMFVALVFLKRL